MPFEVVKLRLFSSFKHFIKSLNTYENEDHSRHENWQEVMKSITIIENRIENFKQNMKGQ